MALIEFSDGCVLNSLEEIREQLFEGARLSWACHFVWSRSLALAAGLPADLFHLTEAWRAGSPRRPAGFREFWRSCVSRTRRSRPRACTFSTRAWIRRSERASLS